MTFEQTVVVRGGAGVPPIGVARIGFFRDLLARALAHARGDRDGAETLRRERLELGIDRPELDTVPLWASRRWDGRVEIPWLGSVASELSLALDALRPEAGSEAARRVEQVRSVLRSWEGAAADARDGVDVVAVPERLLVELSGPQGLLAELVGELRGQVGSARRVVRS